jgi:hypothetical protein
MRRCAAFTRSGRRCSRLAAPDGVRCHLHGAAGGRPRGIPMHENTRAALAEGRARWLERMRAQKAAGLIERFPNGRRARGLPPLSKDKKIRRAQRVIEKRMSKSKPVIPLAEWAGQSKAEKLQQAADLSLDTARKILELGVDPSDPKLLALVRNTAIDIINAQIRVEATQLSMAAGAGRIASMPAEQRLAYARDLIRRAAELPPVPRVEPAEDA